MSEHTIQCTFSCDQSWRKMPKAENGRHCGSCNHVVIDFSKKSREEVVDYLSKNENVCGHIPSDYLHPELITETRLPFFKQIAAAVTTVLLSGTYASAQEPVKTEQTVANPTPIVIPDPIAVPDTTVAETSAALPQPTAEELEARIKHNKKIRRRTRGRHLIGKIWIRGKFPFFYRQRMIRGRLKY